MRRLLSLATLAVMMHAGTASITEVQAATVASVTFTATTTSLTSGVSNGVYSFSTGARAVLGASNACATVVAQPIAGTCQFVGSGSFNLTACMTGFLGNAPFGSTDTGTLTVNGIAGGSASFTFNYGAVIVGGIGIFEGTYFGTPITGWVDITPVGGNCLTGVTAWQLTGQVNF